jgi:type VI secretion system secreted protein VgrG
VQGPQTAVVIGKASYSDTSGDDGGGDGEEIWVDTFGRVIVRFPWDRAGACSCRLRVSQDWAGQGWGAITIPRVGQEVIVSFLEGDPDRPIITGRVYNANQTVPYPLPDNQTRSTFKTRSSEGGGADNYNELRFEDKTGSEQIFLRGEKDFDTRLKNDIREWVGNNRSLIVTQDQMEKAGGDLHSQVTGNLNQKIGQTLSLQVGQNLYEKSGTNFAHEAGQVIHLKAGMTVVLEAGTELTLKVGGNFIDINSSGISIVGTMVMINSGGAAGSGCGSSPTSPKDPDQADDGSKGGKMN